VNQSQTVLDRGFALALDAAPCAMLVVDPAGQIVLANRLCEELFGYEPVDLIGQPVDLLVPEAQRSAHPAYRAKYLAAPETRPMGMGRELFGRRRDGTTVAVEIGLNPVDTSTGLYVLASIVDISERKAAQAREAALVVQLEARVQADGVELRERARIEQWLRIKEAVNRALVAAGALEDVGRYVLQVIAEGLAWELGELWLVDAAAGRLRRAASWRCPGWGETEFEVRSHTETFTPGVGLPGRVWMTGKPVWLPDAPMDAAFTRASLARAGGLHGACAFPIVAGEQVLGVMAFFEGAVRPADAELLGLMADVGRELGQFIARTWATEALATSELRLRIAVEAGNMGVWDWDARSGRVHWSPGLEAIHGLAPGSFPGTFAAYQEDMHPEDRPVVLEAIGRALREEAPYHVVYRIIRPDGEERWLEAYGRRMRGEADEVTGLTGVCMDITDRKRTEQENTRLNQELERALRTHDEFLSATSHDLKNPLAAIKATADLLRRHMETGRLADAEPSRRLLANIDRSVTQMLGMVQNLLDLVRAEPGQVLALNRGPTDLVAMVEHAVSEVQRVHPEHRIRTEIYGEPAGFMGEWDRLWLERGITNLLDNAVKYSPDGGDVSITVAPAPTPEPSIILTVHDHGVGIPVADLPHIFDRFHRGSNVVGKIPGTGIGLAVVRQVIESHGGTIAIASSPGAGTTVRVSLPLGDLGQAPPGSAGVRA
jgi:PAS domain S-box-containing protein